MKIFLKNLPLLRQGYEDILRHLSDAKINKQKIRVIKNGELRHIKWSEIVVCIFNLI